MVHKGETMIDGENRHHFIYMSKCRRCAKVMKQFESQKSERVRYALNLDYLIIK